MPEETVSAEKEDESDSTDEGGKTTRRVVDDSELFHIGVSPHLRDKDTTTRIMGWVIVALLPLTVYGVYIGGLHAFGVVVMSIIGAVAAEAVMQRLLHKPIAVYDLSALLTGLLLALTLPPRLPMWIPFIGGVVAIVLGKQIFGGLGYNIFNPALVGRAVLFVSWSSYMTTSYLLHPQAAVVNTAAIKSIDSITKATPLFAIGLVRKGELTLSASKYIKPLLFGNPWGCIGEVSAVLILLGLAILLIKRLVDWRIPVCFVGTVMLLSLLKGSNPWFMALSGGLLLGACFMATDYVTNPMTGWGKVVFAVGCGIVTFVLRFYSKMPEGVMFAILLMNGFTPLIDRYIKPRPFGYKVKKLEEKEAEA
jgi:electron transport complex protein RnfD